jgi:hypothetical protein
MEFDSIKKNKPKLTDFAYIKKIVEEQQQQQPQIQPIEIKEPTLFEKIFLKIKNNILYFIENNFIMIFIIIVIICLLIYRYYQYQSYKLIIYHIMEHIINHHI